MSLLNRLFLKLKTIKANNEQYINLLRKKGVSIGKGCVIDKTAIFGTEPYLITVGNNVRITHGVKFITHDGSLWTLRKNGLLEDADYFGKIKIGENSNIGWDATILPNVTIGKNCIVGCGAIVTKDVPDNSVVAGIPAKVIESVSEYYEKRKDQCLPTKNFNAEEKKIYLLKQLK